MVSYVANEVALYGAIYRRVALTYFKGEFPADNERIRGVVEEARGVPLECRDIVFRQQLGVLEQWVSRLPREVSEQERVASL